MHKMKVLLIPAVASIIVAIISIVPQLLAKNDSNKTPVIKEKIAIKITNDSTDNSNVQAGINKMGNCKNLQKLNIEINNKSSGKNNKQTGINC